jgi:hypothetical protein
MEPCMQIKKNIYDQAQEHLGAGFPESLPMEQAYVHIGMYLGWIIDSGFCSECFSEEASTEIFRFKRKEISCTILSEIWNGYLAFEFFDKTGNNFSLFYYTSGLYRQDYEEILGRDLPTIYHVEDTWPNYDKLKMRINSRYTEWHKLRSLLESANEQGHAEGDSKLRVAV